MLKRKVKKVLIIISITIVGLLLVWLIADGALVDRVIVSGRSDRYIDDYDEFYFQKREYRPFFSLGFGGAQSPKYQLRFLPGQRARMQARIREDIIAELEEVVELNGDIIKGYRINDDFKNIYIYFFEDAVPPGLIHESTRRFSELRYELSQITVALKLELYHQLIHGSARTELSNIVNFVEVE